MVSIHKIIMPHKKSNGFNNDTLDENIESNSNTTKSDETSVYITNDNDNSGYNKTQVAQQVNINNERQAKVYHKHKTTKAI